MNTWLVTVRVATAWLFDGLKIATGSAEPRKIWLELSGEPLRSRSEEHTSELQSPCNLVCRLLLEKKKEDIGIAAGWLGSASARTQGMGDPSRSAARLGTPCFARDVTRCQPVFHDGSGCGVTHCSW